MSKTISVQTSIAITVTEKAYEEYYRKTNRVYISEHSSRLITNASGSYSKSIEESAEVGGTFGIDGMTLGATVKQALAQSLSRSWSEMRDVSSSGKHEERFGDETKIKFKKGTSQIYRTVLTTITLNGLSNTSSKQVYMGVGDPAAPLRPRSAASRKWLKAAWNAELGWTDQIPTSGRIVFTRSIKPAPQKLIPLKGHTVASDQGPSNGQMVYLDRQKVEAPGQFGILTGFGLRRATKTAIDYGFTYVQPENASKTVNVLTNKYTSDGGGKQTVYLDRQKVMAPDGEFLVWFRLTRSDGKVAYQYGTRQAPCGATQVGNSVASDWGNGELIYLDRQSFTVPSGCGLRGFELFRPTPSTICYRYWHAKITN